MRFDQRVVIITGAGGGLGRAYALHFASLGASIVVNDLGGSLKGEGASTRAADVVVDEIKAAGGRAVPDYHSVSDAGEAIVQTALSAFGRVDVLINNAGILRDKSIVKMTTDDWDKVMAVHLEGSYKVTKAAWPHMLKQGYGRIISMTSAAGLYGNRGQANYAAAKASLIGFMKALAVEGDAKGIRCYAVAPLAESRFTQTVLPAEILQSLKPEKIAPVVSWLASESCTNIPNGSVFETAAGWLAAVRWERSAGHVLPSSLILKSPTAAVARLRSDWKKVEDVNQKVQYPSAAFDVDWKSIASQAQSTLTTSGPGAVKELQGKVAIVTGGGGGLGRCYCLLLAKLGASVVVNDAGGPIKEKGGRSPAELVVSEIREAGGSAVANKDSVSIESGAQGIIASAMEAFGRLDILVNNAGILRDRSFLKLEHNDWQSVLDVHLKGTFLLAKAAWPVWLKQDSGAWMINTASSVALHGNFGQANYAAAKAGIIGLSQSLAFEGSRHGIRVNTIIPYAATGMTSSLFPPDLAALLKPESVAPIVGVLASCPPEQTGQVYEAGGGWFARSRLQRNSGAQLSESDWEKRAILFEPGKVTYPLDVTSSFNEAMAHSSASKVATSSSRPIASESTKTKSAPLAPILMPDRHSTDCGRFAYTEYDVILYHLGIGANRTPFVYEAHESFGPLPSYAAIVGLAALNLEEVGNWFARLPSFSPMKLLHGAQMIEFPNGSQKFPRSGVLLTPRTWLVEASNIPSGAIVTFRNETREEGKGASDGPFLFANEITLILRDTQVPSEMLLERASKSSSKGAMDSFFKAQVQRGEPDMKMTIETRSDQASLYRLSGDLNPLHIDPSIASYAGYKSPILHGLCSFGLSVYQIVTCLEQRFQSKSSSSSPLKIAVKKLNCRFTKHVFPGESLCLQIWIQEKQNRVAFRTLSKERNEIVVDQGYLEYELESSHMTAPATPSAGTSPTSTNTNMNMNMNISGSSANSSGSELEKTFQSLSRSFSAMDAASRNALMKKLKHRIAFDISDAPSPSVIYMDFKESPENGSGNTSPLCLVKSPPKSPDLTIVVKMKDMERLIAGAMTPQDAFMKGLVKVKGNMALALGLEPLLKVFRGAMAKL